MLGINDFFLIGIARLNSQYGDGVTIKRSTKRLNHTVNLFRKNVQLELKC